MLRFLRDEYPAIRDWLLPFKDDLEKRATKQEWWELQQAQLAYQPKFGMPKIVTCMIWAISLISVTTAPATTPTTSASGIK